MYSFANDYSEGAHESILEEMTRTARRQTGCYGIDEYCDAARQAIQKDLQNPESAIHFLVGGSQTNMIVATLVLRPHQGMVSAASGHVNVHESGAIEGTGHKVLALPCDEQGKLTAAQVDEYIQGHYDDSTAEHMVQPGMVYISNPTENGTIYTKQELTELKAVCEKWNIPLYMDGARLGCALTSHANDLTMADLGKLTDIFYIGGTKMGALFGEALVINNPAYQADFRSIMKQRGGMLAKGKLLGIQFHQLFKDGLYYELAKYANDQARRLEQGIKALGYGFLVETPTNQIFPILPKKVLERLSGRYSWSFWCGIDAEHDAIRLCTSWATPAEMVEAFLADLAEAGK
ncbi:MAG: aminotransferase class I/II-fold pyridoxal phosphate-dependent enzyme [Oscillospiraceae bacterium]|nr:aminotransferase class I/II-fold pyridoxal phosphate-dependent enzyme [Oscillospiraceae bacterium]